jgi:hypothetical protein
MWSLLDYLTVVIMFLALIAVFMISSSGSKKFGTEMKENTGEETETFSGQHVEEDDNDDAELWQFHNDADAASK